MCNRLRRNTLLAAAVHLGLLKVVVKDPTINWTQAVDLGQGRAIGLGIIDGQIDMRQANGFGYD